MALGQLKQIKCPLRVTSAHKVLGQGDGSLDRRLNRLLGGLLAEKGLESRYARTGLVHLRVRPADGREVGLDFTCASTKTSTAIRSSLPVLAISSTDIGV